jgi:cytochrome c553
MRTFISVSLLAALTLVSSQAQNNSIQTDANLKDSTTQVVVERKVYETTKTFQQDTVRADHTIAIIVENRADVSFNDKVAVLEDLMSSRVAGQGFTVLTRDVVTRSLKDYSNGKEPNGQMTAVDSALESGSSALRLAQNIGADYILVPSITSYGSEKKTYNGNGIATVNTTYKLRVSYKIVEGGNGGAVRGGSFVAEKNFRDTGNLSTSSSDVVNELLDDAADQLAAAIKANAKSLPTEVAKVGLVNFKVACSMTDPLQQPILISAIGITADNKVVTTNQPMAMQAMDVTVELDGVAIGSAPGMFQGRPGLHKIRLAREGFDTWERTVNIYDGQSLRVALQMSEAGYERWRDTTGFLSKLDNTRKLTDGEVKQMEGVAEYFKNSHYRVDTKENIHPTYKSLF